MFLGGTVIDLCGVPHFSHLCNAGARIQACASISPGKGRVEEYCIERRARGLYIGNDWEEVEAPRAKQPSDSLIKQAEIPRSEKSFASMKEGYLPFRNFFCEGGITLFVSRSGNKNASAMTYCPSATIELVSSALSRFTTLFGMVRGGSKTLQSPRHYVVYFRRGCFSRRPYPCLSGIPQVSRWVREQD